MFDRVFEEYCLLQITNNLLGTILAVCQLSTSVLVPLGLMIADNKEEGNRILLVQCTSLKMTFVFYIYISESPPFLGRVIHFCIYHGFLHTRRNHRMDRMVQWSLTMDHACPPRCDSTTPSKVLLLRVLFLEIFLNRNQFLPVAYRFFLPI